MARRLGLSDEMLDLALSNEERFLCEVVRHRQYLDVDRLKALYEGLGDDRAFSLCQRDGIACIAADSLSVCIGTRLPQRWNDEYRLVEAVVGEYMRELDRVALLLAREGIPLVALKNSGIARALYQHYGASPMGDVDVLIRQTDFRRASDVLLREGYEIKFRSQLETGDLDRAEKAGSCEYSTLLASGRHLWLELQWRPVGGRWIHPDQEPSGDELIDRSMAIRGSAARLLGPEDNLLQVCLHTAKHSYVRDPGFRLHTDVDRIVRSSEVDWTGFGHLVLTLRVRTAVFFSLALASELLGTPVPSGFLSRIAPPRWKVVLLSRWLQRVGLFDPAGRKWGALGYLVFVGLLYDDVGGLAKNLFPKPAVMRDRHGVRGALSLGWGYASRLAQLLTRRTLVK